MSWFSRPAPSAVAPAPTPTPAAPAQGMGLVGAVFPAEEGLIEAATALCVDPVLRRLLDSLRPDAWVEVRSAIGVFSREPAAALGAAPAVAALLVGEWSPSLDNYAHYGLNEAASFLGKATAATRGQGGPGGRLHQFLSGPALAAAGRLPTPTLQVFHRGMLDWIAQASLPPDEVAGRLGALLDLPVPDADRGWHNQTRAEALRLLVQRRPPQAPPRAPPAARTPPPPSGRSLDQRLVDELRSGDVLRARLALDLLGGREAAAEGLFAAAEALLDDPGLDDHPQGAALRASLLRLLARPAPAAAVPQTLFRPDQPATARLRALAAPGSPAVIRLAALEALTAALPDEEAGLFALADAALAEADPALQRAGVGLWAALARRERCA